MRFNEHIAINSSFIKIIMEVYGDNNNYYLLADKNHLKVLRNKIQNKIVFYPISVIKSRYFWMPISDLFSIFYILKIFFITKKGDYLILLNRLPLCLIVANFISIFFRRNLIVLLHGELEVFVNSNAYGLTKYYYYLFILAYKIRNRNIKYVFLGESIFNAIQPKLKFLPDVTIVIDHPYDYENSVRSSVHPSNKSISFGFIGKGMLRKRTEKIFELAELLKEFIFVDKINISIAGTLDKKLKEYSNALVKTIDNSERVSIEEYEKLIGNLQYSLLFYNENSFLAIASGSFFDCIKYEKPIITLKGNPFIDYYFKKLGNIGYLCGSIFEMSEKIKELVISFPMKEYDVQVINLISAKKSLSIENIKNNFASQLNGF